ncbi:MAG: InlB B-repeat-containing protein, partial [Lentisphaeria bacterium]|nr:InlB B-repeat-containing protein [Lentisphaeria bacterium]
DRGILGYVIGGDYLPGRAAAVVSPPVDCSQAQIVELSFWRWLGVESNDWADASLSVSSDGQDWHPVWANSATDTADDQWQQMVFDLTPWAAGKATVFIAFDISSVEQAFPFCGWNIDDLNLASAAEKLAGIFLQVDRQDIEVGDVFNVDVFVQEDHPDAAGLLGASVRLDFTQGLSTYNGSSTVSNCVPSSPWNRLRRGTRSGNVLTELGGLTENPGSGNGEPVLLARVPMKAVSAGTARFECTPASAFALPSPFGQIGAWRIAGAVLEVSIATDALEPLARLTLSGPTEPVALGNLFEIRVQAEELASTANGFLGGPFDLYFDPDHVSAPDFSAATAIQAPYKDESLGLVSGTLLENRIDELGGATVKSGFGNGSKVLYAVISFQAGSLGECIFEAKAGSSGLTLTTPVGQLPFSRIDYGLPFVVDIRPNYTVTVGGGSASSGNCYEGQIITLTANNPQPGWEFSLWDGDESSLAALASAIQASTSLTVPGAPVSLNAVYRKIDYSLTVNNGNGSATPVHIGEQLQISANPPETGKTFDRWTGDIQYLSDSSAATTTVTIATANVAVTATYRNILYRREIINGSGDTESAIYGQTLPVSADPAPPGYVFSQWVGSEEDLFLLGSRTSPNTNMFQPARDVVLTASYIAIDYQLTVNQGSGTQIANYNYQDVIPIAADPAPVGQAFSHWTGDTACLNDVFAAEATVTMPTSSVTLTAVFKMVYYTLLVVNGTGSGSYTYGSQIDIAADPAPPGSLGFSGWSGHVGTLAAPAQPSTTLTMPAAHTAVIAIYGDSAEINTFELAMKQGWNCFAVPFETANPVGTLDSKGHPITMIWRWDNMFIPPLKPDGTSANTIQPHIGHWIFCPEDCRLTFTKWQQ